jgi:hypothetical protein
MFFGSFDSMKWNKSAHFSFAKVVAVASMVGANFLHLWEVSMACCSVTKARLRRAKNHGFRAEGRKREKGRRGLASAGPTPPGGSLRWLLAPEVLAHMWRKWQASVTP